MKAAMRNVKTEKVDNPPKRTASIHNKEEDNFRDEIQRKWKTVISDAVVRNQIEMARNMSSMSNQVVDYVLSCRDILERSQNSDIEPHVPQYQQNLQPNPEVSKVVPRSSASTEPPGFATSSNRVPVNYNGPSDRSESLLDQLKRNFNFAQIVPPRDNTNADRLMLVFGRYWSTAALDGVVQAIITTNSKNSCDSICTTNLPPMNTVCILPNPDWICSQQNVWDVVDDYMMIIQHVRNQLPTKTPVLLATFPIERDTGYDQDFYQFNQQLKRYRDKHQNSFSLIGTSSLLSGNFDTCNGYKLADDQCLQLMRELGKRLVYYRP